MQNFGVQKRILGYKIDCRVVTLDQDLMNVEAARDLSEKKANSDHLELVIEPKCILNSTIIDCPLKRTQRSDSLEPFTTAMTSLPLKPNEKESLLVIPQSPKKSKSVNVTPLPISTQVNHVITIYISSSNKDQ